MYGRAHTDGDIHLASVGLRAVLRPAWGGRLASLQALGGTQPLDLLVPIAEGQAFDPLAWPKAGAYPLIPYSNRIRNARLKVNGATHTLTPHPAAAPHTLHGSSQAKAWSVQSMGANYASLVLASPADANWPWPYTAEQRYALEGRRLSLDLSVRNDGNTPMPAGLGWHPYVHAYPGLILDYEAEGTWHIDADYLPDRWLARTRLAQRLTPDDWRHGCLTHYDTHWHGRASIQHVHGRLDLKANAELDQLVIHVPTAAPYVCLEPVSHAADGFNRPDLPTDQTGLVLLAPGALLTGRLTLDWHAAGTSLQAPCSQENLEQPSGSCGPRDHR